MALCCACEYERGGVLTRTIEKLIEQGYSWDCCTLCPYHEVHEYDEPKDAETSS